MRHINEEYLVKNMAFGTARVKSFSLGFLRTHLCLLLLDFTRRSAMMRGNGVLNRAPFHTPKRRIKWESLKSCSILSMS